MKAGIFPAQTSLPIDPEVQHALEQVKAGHIADAVLRKARAEGVGFTDEERKKLFGEDERGPWS